MAFCSQCGQQLPEGAQFCQACGAASTVAPQQAVAQAPVQPQPVAVQATPILLPASMGRRFGNLFLDALCMQVPVQIINFAIIIPVIAASTTTDGAAPQLPIWWTLFAWLIYPGYYLFFESIWQRTPGKWATGTKVVMKDGSKPDFWHILGRTALRYVPFDALSFLTNHHPTGWHDRWSGTMVVPHEYTPEQVQQIDLSKREKSTWILVVAILGSILFFIAIFGLIAAIVLASLSVARTKGVDAMRISDVKELQVDLELYRTENGQYPSALSDLTAKSTGVANSIPTDTNGAAYDYYSCSPDTYHLGTSLDNQDNPALKDAAHAAPMCANDPIDGSTGGPCEKSDAGSYCFDVTSDSASTPTGGN